MNAISRLSNAQCRRSPHVAIVEDDPHYRFFIEETVERGEGADVVGSYGKLSDMFCDLKSGGADVLLLDLGVPGSDGIDALPAIRARFPEMSVVVLTADDSGGSFIRALSQGAAGCLLKSSPPQDFSANLHAALQGEHVVSKCLVKYLIENLQSTLRELKELTTREKETFMLVTSGQSYKQTAGVMGVSINTVRTHIRSVYRKLEVRSRTEASHKTRA